MLTCGTQVLVISQNDSCFVINKLSSSKISVMCPNSYI